MVNSLATVACCVQFMAVVAHILRHDKDKTQRKDNRQSTRCQLTASITTTLHEQLDWTVNAFKTILIVSHIDIEITCPSMITQQTNT